MIPLEFAGLVPLVLGAAFFTAGTAGMLRFPDTFSRVHAITKADTLGLGLVVLGLALQAASPGVAAKLALILILVSVASATNAYLVGLHALRATAERSDGP